MRKFLIIPPYTLNHISWACGNHHQWMNVSPPKLLPLCSNACMHIFEHINMFYFGKVFCFYTNGITRIFKIPLFALFI